MNLSLDESLHLCVPKPLPWKIRRSVAQRSVPKCGVSSTPVPLKKSTEDDVQKQFAKYQQEEATSLATISVASITTSSKKAEIVQANSSKGHSIISEHYVKKVINSFRSKSTSTKCTGRDSKEDNSDSSNSESNNNIECDDLFKSFLKDVSKVATKKTPDVNIEHKQEIKVNEKLSVNKSSSSEDCKEFKQTQSRKQKFFKGKSNKIHQRKHNLSQSDDYSSDNTRRNRKSYRKWNNKFRRKPKSTKQQQKSNSEDSLSSPKKDRKQFTRQTKQQKSDSEALSPKKGRQQLTKQKYKRSYHYSSSSDDFDNIVVKNVVNSSKAVPKTFGVHKQVTKVDKAVDSCSMKLIAPNNETKINKYGGRKGVKEYLGPLKKQDIQYCEPSNKGKPILTYDCGIDVQQNKDKRQTLFDDTYDDEIDVVGVDDEHIDNGNSNLLEMLEEWNSTGEDDNKQIENGSKSPSPKTSFGIKKKGSASKVTTNRKSNINIISDILLKKLESNENEETNMRRSRRISEKNKVLEDVKKNDVAKDNDEELNTQKSPRKREEDTQKAKKCLDENFQNFSKKEIHLQGKYSQIVTQHSDDSSDVEGSKINKKLLVVVNKMPETEDNNVGENEIVEDLFEEKSNVKKSSSNKKEKPKKSPVEDLNQKEKECINVHYSTRNAISQSNSQIIEKNTTINEEKQQKFSQSNLKHVDKSNDKENDKISQCEDIQIVEETCADEIEVIEDLCKEKVNTQKSTAKKKDTSKKSKGNLIQNTDDLNKKKGECVNNNQIIRKTRSKSAISQQVEEKKPEIKAQHCNEPIEEEKSKRNKKNLEKHKGKSDLVQYQTEGQFEQDELNTKRINTTKPIETKVIIENVDLSKKDKQILNETNLNLNEKTSVITQKQTEKQLYQEINKQLKEIDDKNVQDGKRKSSIAKKLFTSILSEKDLKSKNKSKTQDVDTNSIINNEDLNQIEKENPAGRTTRSKKTINLQNNKIDNTHKETLSSDLKENSKSKNNKLKVQLTEESKLQSTLQTASKKDFVTPKNSLLPANAYLSSIDAEIEVTNENQNINPYVSMEKSRTINKLIANQETNSDFNFTKPKVPQEKKPKSKKEMEKILEKTTESINSEGDNSSLRRSGRHRTQTKFRACYYVVDSKLINKIEDKSANIVIVKDVKEAENSITGKRKAVSSIISLENETPSTSSNVNNKTSSSKKKTTKPSNKKQGKMSNLKVIEEEVSENSVETKKSRGRPRRKNNKENIGKNVIEEISSSKKNEKRKLSCDEIPKDHDIGEDDFTNVEALEYFKRGQEYIALQESGVYETLSLSYDSSKAGRLKICGSKRSKSTLENCYMHLVVLKGRCKIQIDNNDQRILEKDDYALIPVGSTYSIANDEPNENVELYYCRYQTREENLPTVL